MSQQFLIRDVYDWVTREIERLRGEVNDYENTFKSAMEALGDFEFGADPPAPTAPALPDLTVPGGSVIASPSAPVAPAIEAMIGNVAPPLDRIAQIDAELDKIIAEIPEFTSSVPAITIPPAPQPIDTSGMPQRPSIDTEVTFPDAPVVAMPSLPALTPITIPDFVFPTLPTFDLALPEFTDSAPAAVIAWSEPEYASEDLERIQAKIRDMLAGQSGLPPAVEDALFGRLQGRNDHAAMLAVQTAVQTFASRGFTMPPGMLAAQVNAIVHENQLKANEASREVYVKAQETLIQQLNVAIERGLALEQMNMNLFTNTLNRALEIEKFRLEQGVAIYNAQVQAFNIRSQAYAAAATVFKIRTDAALVRLEEFRARVEAAKATGELNQQLVATYEAQVRAVGTQVDLYKVGMEAAKVQTDVIQGQIQLYKSDLDAYATRVSADKVRFDAYEAQIKGEVSKAQVMDAEARAFASRVQAISTGAQLGIQKVQARLSASTNDTQRFVALVGQESAAVSAVSANYSARVNAFSAELQKYTAEIGRDTAGRELSIKATEAQIRAYLALYEAEIAKFNGDAQRVVQKGQITAESLRVMAQYAAQLAAGAMSARNLGMSMGGNVGSSDSLSRNYDYSSS